MFLPDDNNVALPHAGLLSYFRHSEEPAQTARNATPSWSDTKHGIVDEETQSEFWDSESACSTNTDCEALCQPTHRHYPGIFHTLYDFWGSICLVAIAACAALLGLDIALGRSTWPTNMAYNVFEAAQRLHDRDDHAACRPFRKVEASFGR